MNHEADPSDGVGDTLSPVKRALIEIRELRARVRRCAGGTRTSLPTWRAWACLLYTSDAADEG